MPKGLVHGRHHTWQVRTAPALPKDIKWEACGQDWWIQRGELTSLGLKGSTDQE